MSPAPSPDASPWSRSSQTKIVATVGPACGTVEKLVELIRAGVDVFRVNTAHGDRSSHQSFVDMIRDAEKISGQPVGILVDLGGPKMRLGFLPGGQLTCNSGDTIRFVRGEHTQAPRELVCSYPTLLEELRPDDRIMLADGIVALRVTTVEKDAAECLVLQGGTVRDKQGINLPGVRLTAPSLSDRDRDTAEWATRAGIDFLSLSFVRRVEDVLELRRLVDVASSELQIVAKIEKPEALSNLEGIIAVADAIMVARGDLGVEVDIAEMAVTQKRIVGLCRALQKPVIIATQMLDSMHHSRIPTRAEATDVANAILDGADACMLSGETAVGDYPVEAVQMMHRIALATEPLASEFERKPETTTRIAGITRVTAATAQATVKLAEELDAKLIVVATHTGRAALAVSQRRSEIPTIGVSPKKHIVRRLCLYRGVIPIPSAPTDSILHLREFVVQHAMAAGMLKENDRIVLLSWTGAGSSRHNQISVHEVE
jgi:pyruvate kinase